MLKIYGSDLCKDCLACKEDLDKAGVMYEYCDFSASLLNLKEFLAIRDASPLFEEAKKSGYIGIPCIVKENGEATLSWEEFV